LLCSAADCYRLWTTSGPPTQATALNAAFPRRGAPRTSHRASFVATPNRRHSAYLPKYGFAYEAVADVTPHLYKTDVRWWSRRLADASAGLLGSNCYRGTGAWTCGDPTFEANAPGRWRKHGQHARLPLPFIAGSRHDALVFATDLRLICHRPTARVGIASIVYVMQPQSYLRFRLQSGPAEISSSDRARRNH